MTKTFFATAALLAAMLPAHAVTTVQWTFEGATTPPDLTDSATSPVALPSTGTGVATGLHASAATDWSTPAGNGSTDSFSSNTWAVGDYWQFSFSTTGFTDLTIALDQTGSNTGPRDFKLAYSTNGSTFNDFSSYVLANGAWSSSLVNPTSTYTFDLSALSALDNQPTVVIRLIDTSTVAITGGTVAAGGTSRVDNFTVMLSPVPEPSAWALLLAGMTAVGFVARRQRR